MIKQSANTRGRPFSGVHCVKCGSIDSRNHEVGNARRRRHQCNNCGYRYTTYEVPAEEYEKLQTIKMDVSQIDSVIAEGAGSGVVGDNICPARWLIHQPLAA